jgi:hypothetical protein
VTWVSVIKMTGLVLFHKCDPSFLWNSYFHCYVNRIQCSNFRVVTFMINRDRDAQVAMVTTPPTSAGSVTPVPGSVSGFGSFPFSVPTIINSYLYADFIILFSILTHTASVWDYVCGNFDDLSLLAAAAKWVFFWYIIHVSPVYT